MVAIIVDTSIFIEKIRTKKGVFDRLIEGSQKKNYELCTSSVVLTELWTGESMNYKQSVKEVKRILEPVRIMTIDGEIARKAGDLIRRSDIEGFDALIAATALVHKVQLATLNVKHFEKIKGLKLYSCT